MAKMGNSASRLGFEIGGRPGDDTLPMVFSDFEWALFLADTGLGLPGFWSKLRPSGGGVVAMPKCGILLSD